MFFLLVVNNVRVLVIFKRRIATICKKKRELEYIFLEIYLLIIVYIVLQYVLNQNMYTLVFYTSIELLL